MMIGIQICFSFLFLALFSFSVFALSKILHNCETRIGKITFFLMIFIFAAPLISLFYMLWFAAQ